MYYTIIQYKEFDNGYDVEARYYKNGLDKATANSIARHMNKESIRNGSEWRYGVEMEPDMSEWWR